MCRSAAALFSALLPSSLSQSLTPRATWQQQHWDLVSVLTWGVLGADPAPYGVPASDDVTAPDGPAFFLPKAMVGGSGEGWEGREGWEGWKGWERLLQHVEPRLRPKWQLHEYVQ